MNSFGLKRCQVLDCKTINSDISSDSSLPNKNRIRYIIYRYVCNRQKYSRLRCLLRVKGLVICFYLGWSGSTLPIRNNIIKVSSKSWLLTCNSNITLSLPSYTGSALKRELNFCNSYLSLLYFCS